MANWTLGVTQGTLPLKSSSVVDIELLAICLRPLPRELSHIIKVVVLIPSLVMAMQPATSCSQLVAGCKRGTLMPCSSSLETSIIPLYVLSASMSPAPPETIEKEAKEAQN